MIIGFFLIEEKKEKALLKPTLFLFMVKIPKTKVFDFP